MTETPGTGPSLGAKAAEHVKTAATVMAAVAGAVTALYGVYEKVRSDARQYTSDSYNTLAPQINQMNDAIQHLAQENQQLRQVVLDKTERARTAAANPSPPPVAVGDRGDSSCGPLRRLVLRPRPQRRWRPPATIPSARWSIQ